MEIKLKRYGTYRDGKLRRFADKVKNDLDVSIKEIGDNVRNNAKNLVPVRTGRLQRSLRVYKVSSHSVFVGSSVPYAGYVEYGTVNMSARPYLRPSVEMTAKLMGNKINVRLLKSWESS